MIPLVDLVAQYNSIKPEIDAAMQEVVSLGKFILGAQEKAFEEEAAQYLGVKYAIGVASGTDALVIALRAAGIGAGDEVITPAYSFFASAGAVLTVQARPVFVDIDPESYLIDVSQIEKRITDKTRAILPVHLYGQPADMDEIQAIARKYHLLIVEDNAQAFGAEYKGKKTGSIGDLGCLSFFPTKTLGAYGDGGMVTTNDESFADKVRMLRTHGWRKKYFPELLGYNSRLDEIQAAILRVKLKYVDAWIARRQEIAGCYSKGLTKTEAITPVQAPDRKHIYYQYILRVPKRDELLAALKAEGIASEVYFPQPLHFAPPCRDLAPNDGSLVESEKASQQTLAIPLFPEMTAEQMDFVLRTVNKDLSNLAY